MTHLFQIYENKIIQILAIKKKRKLHDFHIHNNYVKQSPVVPIDVFIS